MSSRKQDKAIQNLQQSWQRSKGIRQEQMQWLLRSLLVVGKSRLSGAGFVLPTVAMVSMVVVLLTTAILLRSFDRSKNASNIRVNQAVLDAATPALDRARAKIDALLADPTLPRETPSDVALYKALNSPRYRFGGETRLKIVNDINKDGTIQKQPEVTLENDETLTTAWKFAVDTDNNGKFDSYTLYGIYFRSPTRGTNGKFNRVRNPLESRTPPMSGNIGAECQNVTNASASLIGDSSWYKSGAKLTKSFFVYTATVPITDIAKVKLADNQTVAEYELYKGNNKGFSALEFQQDRSRIPLINNAVLFQDDLEISPGSTFRLNGRVFTNANLLIGGHGGAVRLYQVSSKNSCFYNEENSKITVGGNVGTGNVADTTDQTPVSVDLFNGVGNDPSTATINGSNRSTNSAGGAQVAYNDTALNRRIALMKQVALSYHPGFDTNTKTINPPPTVATVSAVTQYPQEVKDGFKAKIEAAGGSSLNAQDILADQIEIYLRDRTRRVPYAEVADPVEVNYDYNITVFESGTIEPIADWREPTDANTKLSLNTANLAQTQPEKQRDEGKEKYLGDRVYVGNNLPGYWKNEEGKYVTGSREQKLIGNNVYWTDPSTELRYRTTQVVPLPDVGVSERSGFWEDAAAQQPPNNLSSIGGLRVITGAGIYRNLSSVSPTLSTGSFTVDPTVLDAGGPIPNAPPLAGESTSTPYNLVWSDAMPMQGGTDDLSTPAVNESTAPPDLRMRATAVYHYRNSAGTDQAPIACVSSYYNPTDATTAQNGKYGTTNFFPWGSGGTNLPPNPDPSITAAAGSGRSNNGVVYTAPYINNAARFLAISTFLTELKAQAKLMFPNGRIVNEPLQKALQKLNAGGQLANANKPLSLSENSAIDTAICAIGILNNTLVPTTTVLPHGAIKEASFLDARQVKAIDKPEPSSATQYDLQLEQRQPLEIRVTDINLGELAGKSLGGSPEEFFLPNSGIIYASRDDALPDLSNTSAEKELLSPVDFRLDPTRRPSGIRLINGSNLARKNEYREEEKGLILVTNLPAYIRGNFNLHQQAGGSTPTEEFTETLAADSSNFYTRNPTLNNNFACRKNQSGCGGTGDQWRLATIVSDAITALSGTFKDGFRAQGDYDLRNNAGSSVTEVLKKNGFWDNSFVTSANYWTGTNGFPTNTFKTSYLTNAVTPVQRRANFPEYAMEICRKLPISQCGPNDWVVGYDINGDGDLDDPVLATTFPDVNGDGVTNLNDTERIIRANQLGRVLSSTALNSGNTPRLGAGTTARPALVPADQRYARRVAFARNPFRTLVFTSIGTAPNVKNAAKPLGVGCPLDQTSTTPQNNGCQYPNSGTRTAGTHYGTPADNSLWFRTTDNTTGEPGAAANITYANNRPLYYLPPDQGGTKLILPETPDIPGGLPSLNLPAGNESASDYTVCFGSGGGSSASSQAYQPPTPFNTGSCSSTTANAIDNFLGAGGAYGLLDLTATHPQMLAVGGTVNAITTSDLNVVPINDFSNGAVITLNSTNPNAIFVLQGGNSLSFGNNCNDASGSSCGNGVKLVLNGVSPNNIFWAINGSVKFHNVNGSTADTSPADGIPDGPHRLAGNFIGKGAGARIGANTVIDGGRILGMSNIPNSQYGNTGIRITAVSSEGQPSLVPVLQIHSPEGSPGGNTLNQGGPDLHNQWLQAAGDNTTINAAFISGNSPSRPAEESAGLHNFVRFLERWTSTLNIKGGFMQLRRSAFATGPFSTVLAAKSDDNDGTLSIFGYPFTRYKVANGTPTGTLPYYGAPTRQWGFDVGILSQSPDLFGQRFTQQPVAPPDEFFREVSRDDLWVKNLLCAAQESAPNSNIYNSYAVDKSEQPTDMNCPSL